MGISQTCHKVHSVWVLNLCKHLKLADCICHVHIVINQPTKYISAAREKDRTDGETRNIREFCYQSVKEARFNHKEKEKRLLLSFILFPVNIRYSLLDVYCKKNFIFCKIKEIIENIDSIRYVHLFFFLFQKAAIHAIKLSSFV